MTHNALLMTPTAVASAQAAAAAPVMANLSGEDVLPQTTYTPARPMDANGHATARGWHVAMLVADGVDGHAVRSTHAALRKAGLAPCFVGTRHGDIQPETGPAIRVEMSIDAAPSVAWRAVVIPCGDAGHAILASSCQVVDFVKAQHGRGNPLLVLGAATTLLAMADIALSTLDATADHGIVVSPPPSTEDGPSDEAMARFILRLQSLGAAVLPAEPAPHPWSATSLAMPPATPGPGSPTDAPMDPSRPTTPPRDDDPPPQIDDLDPAEHLHPVREPSSMPPPQRTESRSSPPRSASVHNGHVGRST
jgi:putative intracellular protease/amidase